MSYFHWLGRDGEGPSYTYHGNWDFSDPICRAQPGKFLPIDKTRDKFALGPFKGFRIPPDA